MPQKKRKQEYTLESWLHTIANPVQLDNALKFQLVGKFQERGYAYMPLQTHESWKTVSNKVERFFKEICSEPLPWECGVEINISHVQKVLYIKLRAAFLVGMIGIVWDSNAIAKSEAFFSIKAVLIPVVHQSWFDSIVFPSIKAHDVFARMNMGLDRAKLRSKRQALVKQWKSAGFKQEIYTNGDILMRFETQTGAVGDLLYLPRLEDPGEYWKKKQPDEPELPSASDSFEELIREIERPVDGTFYAPS